MNTNGAMREIVNRAGISQRAASERMGRSPNWLGATLARQGSSEAVTLASLASACGYALVLVPKDAVDGSMLVIDPPSREDDQ